MLSETQKEFVSRLIVPHTWQFQVPTDMKILEWDIYPSPDKAVKIVQDDHYYPLFNVSYSRTDGVQRVHMHLSFVNLPIIRLSLWGWLGFDCWEPEIKNASPRSAHAHPYLSRTHTHIPVARRTYVHTFCRRL
jgi:hypothetical protein